jgi:hypothetical protein
VLIQGRQKVGQFKSHVGMRPHGSVNHRALALATRGDENCPAKTVGLPGSSFISLFLRKQPVEAHAVTGNDNGRHGSTVADLPACRPRGNQRPSGSLRRCGGRDRAHALGTNPAPPAAQRAVPATIALRHLAGSGRGQLLQRNWVTIFPCRIHYLGSRSHSI